MNQQHSSWELQRHDHAVLDTIATPQTLWEAINTAIKNGDGRYHYGDGSSCIHINVIYGKAFLS